MATLFSKIPPIVGILIVQRGRCFFASLLLFPLLATAQTSGPSTAIALEQQGRLAEAETAWRQVIAQNPGDAAAFASLGVVLSKEEKYTDAGGAYRRALALNPNLPGVQLNLGLAEFKQETLQQRFRHSKRSTPRIRTTARP